MGNGEFPPNSGVKMLLTSKRGQESGRNCLEPLQSSAKHCFELVCSHVDALCAVEYNFYMDFPGFSRFWEPGPAQLPSSLGRAPELALSENLEDFGWDFFDLGRILFILKGFSRFPEDFRVSWKDFGDFRKDFSLPASLEPIDFIDIS